MSTQTTFANFLNQAAASIGAVQPGQTLPSGAQAYWRDMFNQMVRTMSVDRFFLFYVPDVAYVLTAAESHEIGPGAAQFDTSGGLYTRPVFVESARIKVGTSRRWPLNLCNEAEWAANPRRGAADADGPLDFYFAAAIKKSTFNLAPLPVNGQTLYVSQWNPLKVFDSTDMALVMEDYYPDDYMEPLKAKLAITVAPLVQKQASQELATTAQNGLDLIRRANMARLEGSQGQSATLQAPAVGIKTSQG